MAVGPDRFQDVERYGRAALRYLERSAGTALRGLQRHWGLAGGVVLAVVLLAVAMALTNAPPRKPEPSLADLQTARQAAFALDIAIRQQFMDRLERDEDPVAVYLAYRDNVPRITTETGKQFGVDLSRVSLLPRNATNAPDEWESRQLTILQFAMEAGIDAQTLELSAIVDEVIDGKKKKVFRWIKPIQMGEHCVTCHGDAVDTRILDLLKQDYPDDEATGQYEYEMRGAYSVRKVLDK